MVKYKTFQELYKRAAELELIEPQGSKFQCKSHENSCQYGFNIWLQDNRAWEYENEIQYLELLTIENFGGYLNYENKTRAEAKRKIDLADQEERASAKLEYSQNKLENLDKTMDKGNLVTPNNPFPKIFTSNKGFQIFEAFKNEIINESTEYADYSFLFGKLKKDEFIHEMKHKKFIDFLGDQYMVKLASKYKQFKYYENAESTEKIKAYNKYKKHFQ